MKRSVVMTCVLLLVAFFLASVVTGEEMGKMQTATGEVTSVDPQGTAITTFLEGWQRGTGCGDNRGQGHGGQSKGEDGNPPGYKGGGHHHDPLLEV
jgi:hypothetical protein